MSRNGSARRAPSGPTTRISPSCSLTNSRLLPSPDRVTLMGLLRPLAKASRVRWSGSPGRVDAVAAAVGEGDGGGVVAADARWLPPASGLAWLHAASTNATARNAVSTTDARRLDGRGGDAI